MIHLHAREFQLFRKYIEKHCGISLANDKVYLVESRLSGVLAQAKIESFSVLYEMISSSRHPALADQVIDAITTNETSWFRDRTPWLVLEELLLPELIREFQSQKRRRVRIWSAACSTGQEPYSIAIAIDQYLKKNSISNVNLEQFEIVATDISRSVLKFAQSGCYDSNAAIRGLDINYRNQYFYQDGDFWHLSEPIKQIVKFIPFNLQQSFADLGYFDIVFCRYVAIYFSESAKHELFQKICGLLAPPKILFIGASEILTSCRGVFSLKHYQNGVYYQGVNG